MLVSELIASYRTDPASSFGKGDYLPLDCFSVTARASYLWVLGTVLATALPAIALSLALLVCAIPFARDGDEFCFSQDNKSPLATLKSLSSERALPVSYSGSDRNGEERQHFPYVKLGKKVSYGALAALGLILGMLGIHCHNWHSLLRINAIFFGLFLCVYGLGNLLILLSENVSAAPGIDASAPHYGGSKYVRVLPIVVTELKLRDV